MKKSERIFNAKSTTLTQKNKLLPSIIIKNNQENSIKFQWKNQIIFNNQLIPINIYLQQKNKESINIIVTNSQIKIDDKKIVIKEMQHYQWLRINLGGVYKLIVVKKKLCQTQLLKKMVFSDYSEWKTTISVPDNKLYNFNMDEISAQKILCRATFTGSQRRQIKNIPDSVTNKKVLKKQFSGQNKNRYSIQKSIKSKQPKINKNSLQKNSKTQLNKSKQSIVSIKNRLSESKPSFLFNHKESLVGKYQKDTTVGGTSHLLKQLQQLDKHQYSRRLMRFDAYKAFDTSGFQYVEPNNSNNIKLIDNHKSNNQKEEVVEEIRQSVSTANKQSHLNEFSNTFGKKDNHQKNIDEPDLDQSKILESSGTLYESKYE